MEDYLKGVSCMRQSTVRIEGEKTVYFDPYLIEGTPKDADIIFISHSHGDHFSPKDIKKVMKDADTMIVIPASCKAETEKEGYKNIFTVDPTNYYTVDGISIEAVPAYNTKKNFHTKDSKFVGYILDINNTIYYFAGDTDATTEMAKIKADVIFLPVGGTYTMDAKEAACAANTMKPLVAVPIHYEDVVGTAEDAKTFVSLLNKPILGVILKK